MNGRLRAAAAALLLAAAAATPAGGADPDHGVTAGCEWFFTGIPDTTTVALRIVAESQVIGHPGLVTNDVECTVYSDTEAIQVRGTNAVRDQTIVGGGLIEADALRTCVRAAAQWATKIDTGAGEPSQIHTVDTHRAEYSDPAGCLPPCHLVPPPPHCPGPTTEATRRNP